MADNIDQRDFFISFNSADLAFAEAIDTALTAEGFVTFYHPRDLPPGGHILIWMDDALLNSAQTLALYSPDYTKDKAVYSKVERYASLWQDPGSDERKLIPVLLRTTNFTPLMAPLKRIDVTGMTPNEAGAHVVSQLTQSDETEQRNYWRAGLPLPKIFHAAYRPNPNFTGRLEALESLHQSLRAVTNAAVTAVAGMGGIGKTTLAAEYCHRFGGRYGGVWWIRSEQEPVMLADLQALGQRLGVVSGENIEADARTCLDHLASLTQPWLLVYDNAPNPDAVRKWLPTGAVRCIITSRFTEFGDVAPVTRLDEWSNQVTADYLLSRTERDDIAGAARLAKQLGGLPVAAEQAAVYLRPRAGISFDDYAADIARLIKLPRPAGATGDYPDTVYAAFVKSLETLAATEQGEKALDLLRFCAFLSPDGVDLALLTVKGGHEVLPTSLAVTLADKFKREDALAALASLSLLRQEGGSAGAVLIFHRLLLEVTRDWMGEHARANWGGAAVELVNKIFPYHPDDEPSQWPICARLMAHVTSLQVCAPQRGRALSRLLNQACLYLKARGDRRGALALAEHTVALVRRTGIENPLALAIYLSNLGGRYADLGHLEEAERAYRETLEIEEPRLDPNDSSFAITISNLAGVYTLRKNFAQAEPLYLRASAIMKEAHGAESPEYGTSLSNLGELYSRWSLTTGQEAHRAQAEDYQTQALTVTRVARGPRHPSTATMHNNLAVMKANMSDWPAAAIEAELAVAIMLSLDLAQHPDTQQCARDLIYLWEQSRQPDKAARLQSGDNSDLLPVIEQVEMEHRAWVAEDPENRHFGPPSPFASSWSENGLVAGRAGRSRH